MCGLSFFFIITALLRGFLCFCFFLSLEVRVFDCLVRNVFWFLFLFLFYFSLLAEKPNCGLYNVLVDVFICKLYTYSWWTRAVCHFFFFVISFVLFFVFLFSTCKLYILRYTEDKILFGLPEVEVLDRTRGLFSWYQGSKRNCCIRWASVSLWWKCDLLL